MEASITTDFDIVRKIFIKVYVGKISLDFIIQTWNDNISGGIIPKETKRFIIDYSEATIDFSKELIGELADFYKSHNDLFGQSKMAMIMVTPDQVVFPYLLEMQGIDFEIKTFFTRKAATDWLGS